MTEEKAHESVNAYRELYPNLRAWQLEQVERCVANRFTCFKVLGKANKLSEDAYFWCCYESSDSRRVQFHDVYKL